MTRSLPRRLAYRRRERPCREYGRTGWGRADPRLHAHIPEEIRLARAALADEERRIANFVGFIGDGKGTAALAEALRSAENKALEAREQLRTLEGTAADVFATPPVEWVAERLVKLQEVLERETAPSALLLRRILGPIRLIPVTPQVGRPYYQAETALQVLELIQDPGGFEFIALVEAVGIEPTSGNPQPQASTSIVDLRYCFSPRGTPIDRITARPASKVSPLP